MMTAPRNISLLLLSAIAFMAAGAQAADIPLRGPIPFDSFDADGNKMISPQEFVEAHNQRKKMRADANMPMGRMPGNQSFTDFDTNGDNLISAEELEAGRTAMRQGKPQGMQPGRGPGMGRGMGPGMGPGMGRGMGPGMGPGMGRGMGPGMGRGMGPGMGRGMGPGMYRGSQMPEFDDYDLNGDGSLSSEEFYEGRAQRMRQRAEQGYLMRNSANAPGFESIDTNADGKITPEEFAAHQAERLQLRRRPPY